MAYTWRGNWSAAEAYPQGSWVSFNGADYTTLTATTAGQTPPNAPWNRVRNPSPPPPTPGYTLTQFRAQPVMVIAHRGSGAEYPEHNMVGYDASAQLLRTNGYVPAIEVSLVASADKELFAMHDPDFDKTTIFTGPAVNKPWSEIAALVRSDETDYLGQGWPPLRLSTAREIMDRFSSNTIIFIEAKTNQSVQPLQRMLLEDYPQARQNIVVKMPYNNPLLAWAKTNGFTTWGYLDGDGLIPGDLATFEASVDMWGLPAIMSDANMSTMVARPGGKPCIVWEVHRREQARHLTADLGIKGIMCSRIGYVTRTTNTQYTMKMLAQDNFSTRVMMPGMLEADATIPATEAARLNRLKFDASDGSVYFPVVTSPRSCCLGGLNEVPAPASYNILYSVMFPVLPPAVTELAAFAFCKADDRPYIFASTTNVTEGYHAYIRSNGNMGINRHTPGSGTSTAVAAEVPTTAMVPGAYATFRIEVRADGLQLFRTDGAGWSTAKATAATALDLRGPYAHITSGNNLVDSAATPHWRGVSMPSV